MAPNTDILRLVDSLSLDSDDGDLRRCILAIKDEYPCDETVAAHLARRLAASGIFIDQGAAPTADVASTGGPSSLSTLLCPLFLRAAGATVPKLGVPGRPAGGIDCLAQIPEYRTTLSRLEVQRILQSGGYAHFLAEGQLAPLDGRMFRLRQATDAQAVPTLVAASLLSKKLAVGVKSAGLDVRVAPHGNFGTSWNIARRNSKLFLDSARLLGIQAYPVLTDARFPCQPYLGRRESLVALSDVFADTAGSWLREHVETCRTLATACVSEEGRKSLAATGPDILLRHFARNIDDQGCSIANFERLVAVTRSEHTATLKATRPGFCRYPLQELRDVFVDWQKQFERPSIPFPDPVGLIFLRRPGTWVGKGDPLATLRADSSIQAEAIEAMHNMICNPAEFPSGPGIEGIHD